MITKLLFILSVCLYVSLSAIYDCTLGLCVGDGASKHEASTQIGS